MITVNGIQIATRHELIHNFTFDFQNQHMYLITAENGSGKTTLLRTMVGLLKPVQGTISIDGTIGKPQKATTFFWESSDWLNPQLTGFDYLEFVHQQWHSSLSLSEIITSWGMDDYIKIPIKKYSLGMKQRLVIALYEASNAQNLLMDEISNGLDKTGRQLLYARLRSLTDSGKCLIVTSHYRDEIVDYIDTHLSLEAGKIFEVAQ